MKEHKCDRIGRVYLLKCNICDHSYIGETHRKVRERIGEHHFPARNKKTDTAWGEHMRTEHPDLTINKAPIFTAKLIATSTKHTVRKFREAMEIRDRKPTVNRSKGWALI